MAKTTKDTAKEWIEGLRELSKELMDDSKEHRKEANEHKKQANTLNQIEDGIKETLNIKAEGGQIDFDSVVDTGQPHDMLKKGGYTSQNPPMSNEVYMELDRIKDWKIIKEKKHPSKRTNAVFTHSVAKDKDLYFGSGDFYRNALMIDGKIKYPIYFTKKDEAEKDFNSHYKEFAKGGKTMSREDITEVLKNELEPIMEELESDYEGYNLKGEEVEYKSRDGFIPFTDGGYEYDFYVLGDYLRSYGINLPTNTLDAELERVEALNREYGLERFEEEYPEIVKELGGIENVEYNALSDAGYDSEAELLDEYSRAEDDTIYFGLEAFYYKPDNDRGKDGKHTIYLSGYVNMEAPYHRRGKYEDYIDFKFTFNSISDLKKQLDDKLPKIKDWFDGKNYKEGKELNKKIYAKGGTTGDEPRIYVADLKAYNEGKLIGEWVDLTDFDSGEEVIEHITELMEKYSKEHHNGEETEYAIHDYENFDSGLYSESMGEEDFDTIIITRKISEERDIPAEVIQEFQSDTGYDIDELESKLDESFEGQFDTEEDFAENYIDMVGGIENISNADFYFDYEKFGRDLVMDYSVYGDGYYFRNFEQGGEIPNYDLSQYMKKGGKVKEEIKVGNTFSLLNHYTDEMIDVKVEDVYKDILGRKLVKMGTSDGEEVVMTEAILRDTLRKNNYKNYAKGGVISKMSYDEFIETLKPYEIEGGFGKTLKKGMKMYYLKSTHPLLNYNFDHQNKRKAYKEYVDYISQEGNEKFRQSRGYAKGGEIDGDYFVYGYEEDDPANPEMLGHFKNWDEARDFAQSESKNSKYSRVELEEEIDDYYELSSVFIDGKDTYYAKGGLTPEDMPNDYGESGEIVMQYLEEENIGGEDRIDIATRILDNQRPNETLSQTINRLGIYGTGGFLLGNMLGGYLGYKLGKSMEQDDDVFGTEREFGKKVAKSVKKGIEDYQKKEQQN